MKKVSNSDVTVVIAALNEEKGIGPTLRELREALEDPCFLVVDGRSVDGTVEVARGLGADVYVQSGRGKGQAVSEALIHVG
jgi:dolichol-phosphate mannosyltransferase